MKPLKVFILLTLFITISDRLLFVLFPTYLIEKNFSATEIGLIFAAAALFLVILRTYIGKLSDSHGRKKILSAGLLINSLSTFLYPLASKIYEFIVVRVIKEISDTLNSSVESSLQADSFSRKERPKYLIKLGKAYTISRAIAAVIGIIITTYLSIALGFYVAAASMFAAFLILIIFFKEKNNSRAEKKGKLNPLKYDKNFKFMALIGFVTSLVFGIMYAPAFFIFGEKYLGISASGIFLLFLTGYILSTIFIHIVEKKKSNFGTKRIMLTAMALYAFFSFIYLFSNVIAFVIAAIGIAVSYYFWRIAFRTVTMDMARPERRGEQLGFIQTLQGIGDVFGPLIGGLLIDTLFIQAPFLVGGALYAAAAVLILKRF